MLSHGAAIGAGTTASSGSTGGLSKPALYAVIGGASAGGILLFAVIGFCCWKRRKTRAEEDNLGWRDLDSGPAARPIRESQLVYNAPAEKPWAQQSFSSFASFDGKSPGIAPPPQTFVRSASDNFSSAPSHAGDSYLHDRQELFSSPRAMPRNYTNDSLHSFAPPPSVFAHQQDPRGSTAQSVNSVIDFSSASPHRIMSSQQSHPPRQPHAYPPSHASMSSTAPPARNVSSIGREPITAQNYSSRPYSRTHRGYPSIDSAQHRTEDGEVEQRVFAVMVSGQPDADAPPATSGNKKDTIIGLTDAYGGVDGDEQREQSILAVLGASNPSSLRLLLRTARADPPQRTSSRKDAAATSAPIHSAGPPIPTSRNDPFGPAEDADVGSSRVDSKPLRDLEALFERLPAAGLAPVHEEDGSSASIMSRASGASTYAQRYTHDEGAFSLQAPPTRKGSLAPSVLPVVHAPSKQSYLDVSETPSRAGFDHDGFESLDAMNARKNADPSYRSATLSMYDMY